MQTPTCRAHDRKTGQPCTAPPHANTGLCPKHGGLAVEKSIQTNTKHSLFARILPQALTQHFHNALDSPSTLDLDEEMALLRAFLAHYLSTFQEDQTLTPTDLDIVGRHAERISRLAVRHARLAVDAPDRITQADAGEWTRRVRDLVVQVLGEFLPDLGICNAAYKRLTALMVDHELLSEAHREQPQEPDRSLEDGSPSLARDECARSARERSSGTSVPKAFGTSRASVGSGARSDPPRQADPVEDTQQEPDRLPEQSAPPADSGPSEGPYPNGETAPEKAQSVPADSGGQPCRALNRPAGVAPRKLSGQPCRPADPGVRREDVRRECLSSLIPHPSSLVPGQPCRPADSAARPEDRSASASDPSVPTPQPRQMADTDSGLSTVDSGCVPKAFGSSRPRRDPPRPPKPQAATAAPPSYCSAWAYNALRRCMQPAVPGTDKCERHTNAATEEEYLHRP